jgi:hypothetical protein
LTELDESWRQQPLTLRIVYNVLLQQGLPEFTFGNQAGLEMLETTSGALQDLAWEKTLDENGRKTAYTDFTQVLQQVSWKVMT